MRWLALLWLLCAAIASPAVAQGVPREHLTGVWAGTVGNQPVHACFDWRDWRGNGELEGVYYYDTHLAPIRLVENGADLAEQIGYDELGSASWRLDRLTAASLSATFIDGARRVPIRLQRIEWQPREYYSEACASAAFIDPRFAGGRWSEEAGEFGGQALFTTNYIPPPNLVEEGGIYPAVQLAGLRLVETAPGDAAINSQLAQIVSVELAKDCLAGNAGRPADWSVNILPEVITSRWLGLIVANGNYCGGVHPNHYAYRDIYDRQSGEKLTPGDWFTPAGMAREWLETGDPVSPHLRTDTPTPALLNVVMAHWPLTGEDLDPECREVAGQGRGWNVGLVPGGVAFMPELPHAAQGCAETVTVPWADLAPFLSDEGRVAAASLAGS